MARNSHEFQTIRSEGGLLPPDLPRRVVDPKANLPGTKPEDKGLPQGERIHEAITQSWNRMRRHWAEFRGAARNLPENEPGTGLTNDKRSVPRFRELGFGLLPTSAVAMGTSSLMPGQAGCPRLNRRGTWRPEWMIREARGVSASVCPWS